MKSIRTLLPILFVAALVAAACTGSRPRYERVLQRAHEQNQAYDSITNVDSLRLAADYFDRHGTPNERMRAHYLLGCAYRDMGDAPRALESYHDAADRADTTSRDCDYGLLCRVHSQTAYVFDVQNMPHESIEEDRFAMRFAWKAGDTLSAITLLGQIASEYYVLNKPDSTLLLSEEASRLSEKYGYQESAGTELGPSIYIYLKRGNYKKAKEYLDRYEYHSDLTGQEPFKYKNFYLLYHYKGLYSLGIGQKDSAEYYFRKQITEGETPLNRELGSRGLYMLYKEKDNLDSVTKYADLSYSLKDSLMNTSVYADLQRIRSLYNYSRYQQKALQKTVESRHRLWVIFAVSLLGMLVASVLAYYIWRQRMKNKIERQQLTTRYNHLLKMQEQAREDLRSLMENDFSKMVSKKEQEINEREKTISELQALLNIEGPKDTALRDTDIYKRFIYLTKHPKEKVCTKDWEQLQLAFDNFMPSFFSTLHSRGHLSMRDYCICMLIRMRFTSSEIAVLMEMSKPDVSKRRRKMLNDLYGINDKPEVFDKAIMQI